MGPPILWRVSGIPKTKRTAKKKVDRDARLVADRARGMGWEALGVKYDISEKQARNIWKERDRFVPAEGDAFDEVFGILESLAVAAEDFNEVAQTTDNASNRIGAIRHRVDVQLRRFELMRQFGLVPAGLSEAELLETLNVVLGVLSRATLSEEDRQELARALSVIDAGRGRWIRGVIPPALAPVDAAETGVEPDAKSAAGPRTVGRIR